MNEDQIAEHIRNTPPICVNGFHLTTAHLPEPWDNNFTTVYRLNCKCGSGAATILGHPLRDYNPDCDDNDEDLITPLGFQCSQCNIITEIIDTDIHGYHSEVANLEGDIRSVKYRGDGSRTKYKCPKCSTTTFKDVTVGFVYWDFDIMIDEPELPGQEFFNVFLFYVSCQSCGHVSRAIDLGKL